jgi:hypothetical protein
VSFICCLALSALRHCGTPSSLSLVWNFDCLSLQNSTTNRALSNYKLVGPWPIQVGNLFMSAKFCANLKCIQPQLEMLIQVVTTYLYRVLIWNHHDFAPWICASGASLLC